MYKKISKEPVYYAVVGICGLFCWGFIANGSDVNKVIILAIKRCLNVIIPSLFAFMTLSDFLIKSGLFVYVAKPFKIISKYILKMPEELFFVFLIGNFAGYPVGIKLLGDMVKKRQISKKTAEISACFCCCGGPAFYTGTVGLGLFGNTKIGLAVFLSIVSANFISAFFLCRIFRLKALKAERSSTEINADFSLLTDSVLNAGKGLFTICTMIVFFSASLSVMEYFGLFNAIKKISGVDENLIKSFFEITFITTLKNPEYKILPLITAICSFGGLCVIMQIFAVNAENAENEKRISLKYFLLSRPLNACLSAIIFCGISRYVIPDTLPAISSDEKFLVNINNFSASICLILMILLLKYKKRVVISE